MILFVYLLLYFCFVFFFDRYNIFSKATNRFNDKNLFVLHINFCLERKYNSAVKKVFSKFVFYIFLLLFLFSNFFLLFLYCILFIFTFIFKF